MRVSHRLRHSSPGVLIGADAQPVRGSHQRQAQQRRITLNLCEKLGIRHLHIPEACVGPGFALCIYKTWQRKTFNEAPDLAWRHRLLLQIDKVNCDATFLEESLSGARGRRVFYPKIWTLTIFVIMAGRKSFRVVVNRARQSQPRVHRPQSCHLPSGIAWARQWSNRGQATRRAGIQARDQIGDHFAGPQNDGHCSARIAIRAGMNLRGHRLMHCLPAAEG